ncbi:hypothetical protein RIF29_31691 [Crotalaria pallida]|uniref:Uncharacterized protein n=1 Tax=Crotalaria pallida TaxID=3830 RepID=A0AAN9EHY2_CROPI
MSRVLFSFPSFVPLTVKIATSSLSLSLSHSFHFSRFALSYSAFYSKTLITHFPFFSSPFLSNTFFIFLFLNKFPKAKDFHFRLQIARSFCEDVKKVLCWKKKNFFTEQGIGITAPKARTRDKPM